MFYQLYELNHAAMSPWRVAADAMRMVYTHPLNPMAETPVGRAMSAGLEVFERTTRRYGKPEFVLRRQTLTVLKFRLLKKQSGRDHFVIWCAFSALIQPVNRQQHLNQSC